MIGKVKPFCLDFTIRTNPAAEDVRNFDGDKGHYTAPDNGNHDSYYLAFKFVFYCFSTGRRVHDEEPCKQCSDDSAHTVYAKHIETIIITQCFL